MSVELQDLGLPDSTTIFKYNFPANLKPACLSEKKVENVELKNLQSIDDDAFAGCTSLTSLMLSAPDAYDIGCQTLFGNTSRDNLSLARVNLYGGIKDIYTSLSGISSLNELNLPAALTCIHTCFLSGCSIKTLELQSFQNATLESNALSGLNELANVSFKTNFKDSNAFNIGLQSLPSIMSVHVIVGTGMGLKAATFSNCQTTYLIFNDAGSNVTSLETGTFAGCQKVLNVNLSNATFTGVPPSAFANCEQLTSVNLPETIKALSTDCFKNCAFQVELPDSLEEIYPTGMTRMTVTNTKLPSKLHIFSNAFKNTTFSNINTLQLTSNAIYVEPSAFIECNISALMTRSLASIPSRCFYQCANLTQADIQNATVGTAAFAGCIQLASVSLSNCKTVESSAFYDCALESADLSAVTHTGNDAFRNNDKLTTITCNSELLKTGNLGLSTFAGCTSIKTIFAMDLDDMQLHRQLSGYNGKSYVLSVDYMDRETSISSVYKNICEIFGLDSNVVDFSLHLSAGLVINKTGRVETFDCLSYEDDAKTILSGCDPTKKDYQTFLLYSQLPSTVKCIRSNTFNRAKADLTYLNLANTELIENDVFAGASKLSAVSLNSVTSIGNSAFKHSGLLSIELPYDLTYLGASAFYGCSSLTCVSSDWYCRLSAMHSDTFNGCTTLSHLALPYRTVSFDDGVFRGSSILNFKTYNLSQLQFDNEISIDNRISAANGAKFYSKANNYQYPKVIANDARLLWVQNDAFNVNGELQLVSVDTAYLDPRQISVPIQQLASISSIARDAFASAIKLSGSITLPENLYLNGLTDEGSSGFFTNMHEVIVECNLPEETDISGVWTKMFNGADDDDRTVYFNDYHIIKSGNRYVKALNDDPLSSVIDSDGTDIVVGVIDALVPANGHITALEYHNRIASNAFSKTDRVASLDTGNISSICDFAFDGNTSLQTLNMHDCMTQVAQSAFTNSGLSSVDLLSTIDNADICGFGLNRCAFLREIKLCTGISSISPSAFIDACDELTAVGFTPTIADIGSYAFAETRDSFPRLQSLENFDDLQISVIQPFTFYNSIKANVCNDNVLCMPATVLSILDGAFAYNRYTYTQEISGFAMNAIDARNVECIGPSAFIYNRLKSVDFGENLRQIDDYAFAYSKFKYEIDIPGSIQHIGTNAFFRNKILNPAAFDKNIAKVGKSGIRDMLSVFNVNLDARFAADNVAGFTDYTCISAVGDGSDYYSDFAIVLSNQMNFCPDNVKIDLLNRILVQADLHATSAFIPAYIKEVGEGAFLGATELTSIEAEVGLKFNLSSFAGCQNLQFFNSTDSIYYIDNAPAYVFSGCAHLHNVRILSTVTEIGECAFAGCARLSAVQEMNEFEKLNFKYWTLSAVHNSAFYQCKALSAFYFPRTILELGENTFDACDHLDNIYVDLDSDSFKDRFKTPECPELSDIIKWKFQNVRTDNKCYVNFNDITYTNDGLLKNDNEFVDIENGSVVALHYADYCNSTQTNLNLSAISSIDPFVFCNVEKLRRVAFLENQETHENIRVIGDYAFAKCYNLAAVNGSYLSVERIGDYAFADCRFMTQMTIDAGAIAHIGQGAFFNTNLNKLEFSNATEDSVEKIKMAIGFSRQMNRNPMELPEFCEITFENADGMMIGKFDYMFNDLMNSSVDINANQIVFVDKSRDYVCPLLLVKAVPGCYPAIVSNTFHATVIGRWK